MDRDPYPGMASSAVYDTGRSFLHQLNPAMINPWNLPIMVQPPESRLDRSETGNHGSAELAASLHHTTEQRIELLEFICTGSRSHTVLCAHEVGSAHVAESVQLS
ncbi:uncharacterized protein BDW47DRAFT_103032 [Aspergillus candidus]|uniref:Uncharacterized protein n=1 Tax=Aspergillus candidus TaxID=41067 RepID=A0A2I2FFK4_ASPCN|nr:hypothetical protein BDW47DRAFT_103032 [Aspergillus candidus]PLB39422.1 hypothetical protein BDW47DRAFT_103032 [Aspergillus candidus]